MERSWPEKFYDVDLLQLIQILRYRSCLNRSIFILLNVVVVTSVETLRAIEISDCLMRPGSKFNSANNSTRVVSSKYARTCLRSSAKLEDTVTGQPPLQLTSIKSDSVAFGFEPDISSPRSKLQSEFE